MISEDEQDVNADVLGASESVGNGSQSSDQTSNHSKTFGNNQRRNSTCFCCFPVILSGYSWILDLFCFTDLDFGFGSQSF